MKFARRESTKTNIVKAANGKASLNEICKENGVKVAKFVTPKKLVITSTMFKIHNIHKYALISPCGNAHNHIDHVLIEGGIR
jgi:hypothetical protein